MRLRYMIEHALHDRDSDPHYEPIGVWVQGPGPGLDIIMEYLPATTSSGRMPTGSSTDWWKTISSLCLMISWSITGQLCRRIAECGER